MLRSCKIFRPAGANIYTEITCYKYFAPPGLVFKICSEVLHFKAPPGAKCL